MISSPWAMLITFISPKEKVRPMAMSSKIDPRLTALKPCESQMDNLFPPPRSIRGDQRAGLRRGESPALRECSLLLLLFDELGAPGVSLQIWVGLYRGGSSRDFVNQAV